MADEFFCQGGGGGEAVGCGRLPAIFCRGESRVEGGVEMEEVYFFGVMGGLGGEWTATEMVAATERRPTGSWRMRGGGGTPPYRKMRF